MAEDNCHKKHENSPTNTEHPIRAFDPSWNELYQGQMSDILVTCPGCHEYHLRVRMRFNPRKMDPSSKVIFIDGACRNNGTYNARASIGIFFGPGCERNYGEELPDDLPATNQVAELYAATTAIQDTIDHEGDRKLCKLLIVTDSKYVVDGISDWIWKWKRNGWKTSNGTAVTNRDGFEELDRLVKQLEAKDTDVWFWHVPRALNREADRLAKEALD
jgi:ribonuclease HI